MALSSKPGSYRSSFLELPSFLVRLYAGAREFDLSLPFPPYRAGSSPVLDIVGIVIGHLYHFLMGTTSAITLITLITRVDDCVCRHCAHGFYFMILCVRHCAEGLQRSPPELPTVYLPTMRNKVDTAPSIVGMPL
jgi:hypothetical protein